MAKELKVALIAFTIWRPIRDIPSERIHGYTSFRFHLEAPRLEGITWHWNQTIIQKFFLDKL